jgi:uncharacterized repeat protein (TIGR01451 family)
MTASRLQYAPTATPAGEGRNGSGMMRRVVLGVVLAAAAATAAYPQAAGFQEYFVLGNEQHVWTFMERVRQTENAAAFAASNRMNSIVSMTATVDGQVIYYDHWEDNVDYNADGVLDFEPNVGTPVQANTLIFGDGIAANGRACDWTTDPRVVCGGPNEDLLFAGTYLALASNRGIGGACPAGVGFPLWCSIPMPRAATDLRFDGGDRVVTTGSSLSIAHVQDPGTPLIGGGTELLARALVEPAVSYSVPVGEDLFPGLNNAFISTKFVNLGLVAFEDNTQVTVTSPGFPAVSFTLMAGQHWSSCATFVDDGTAGAAGTPGTCTAGAIDGNVSAALMVPINAGTRVSTTGPLNGLIFTGGPAQYATRHYALLPDLLHGTDYVVTAPGDDPAVQGSRGLNLYIFNPNPLAPITVTMVDSLGTTTATIPPGGVIDYLNTTGRDVPSDSTVRLTSSSPFWGVSTYGQDDNISDWGHAWLATRFLTTDYTVAYSPGTEAAPPGCAGPCNSTNRNAVFVAGTQNNTQVRVDFDNDGLWNFIDTNSDNCPDNGTVADAPGACEAATAPVGCPALTANMCVYVVNAPGAPGLDSLRIWDYGDFSNAGTHIVTTAPVALSWGQDVDQGEPSDQSPDNGYTVYPTSDLFIDPVLSITKTPNVSTVPLAGGNVTYTLAVRSHSFGPLTNLVVTDLLPVGVPGTAYVAGSTLITYPDLSQSMGDPSVTTVAGRDRLQWPLTSTTLQTFQTLTIRYTVTLPAGASARLFTNNAAAVANLGGSVFRARASATVTQTAVTVTKTVVDDGQPEVGDVLTYTLVVANNGVAPETNVSISDVVPPDTTYIPGSETTTAPFVGGCHDPAQNSVIWNCRSMNVLSITRAGNTATVNTVGAHGFATGNLAILSGATQPQYNGSFPITVVDADTFTYTVLGTPATPATGTITASVLGPAATLAVGATSTLSFQVRINAGTVAGTVIPNTGRYSSLQSGMIPSNPVTTTVVAPVLVSTKTVTPGPLHPGEVATFEIRVQNTGGAGASNVVISDPLAASNTAYLAGSMEWRLNAGAFTPLTDAADADAGTVTGTTLSFALATLGAGQELTFRFEATVTGTSGQFVTNQATVSSTQTGPQDTNLTQIPIVGNATVTGHVWLDIDGDRVQDPDEPNLANVTVRITDSAGNVQLDTTDAFGNFTAIVPAGATVLDVDQTDTDIPAGSTLTTVTANPPNPTTGQPNDPQTITAVANATRNFTNVGYQPPPVSVRKVSSANGSVLPGQTITYTVTITNNSGATQTGITVDDPLPPGTTYVAGTSQIRAPIGNGIRVTEYFLDNAGADSCTEAGTDFAGLTCTLTLNQALAQNYFVIVQGSDADGTNDTQPDQDYAALTGAPAGSPGTAAAGCAGATCLTNSPAANQLVFSRVADDQNWSGVITVVECIAADCATDGFVLRDARRVAHAGAGTVGSLNTTTAWTDLSRVALIGGYNGAGCTTTDTTDLDHEVCHVRLFPTGTNTMNWTRDATDGGLTDATSTVMAVQWGTTWSVQRATILNGDLGGPDVDAAGEYNTAAINPVTRYRTWVWGTGHTDFGETGSSGEGVILTLGNGQAQNPTESTVAAGVDVAATSLDFDIYTMSHPNLQVDYRFVDTSALGTQPVATDTATADRMALVYNSLADQDDNYPGPIFGARYTSNTNIDLIRRRTGSNFSAWVQGINFGTVPSYQNFAGGNPSLGPIVTPATLCGAAPCQIPPGASLTVTFQVLVDKPLAAGITQIDNVAGYTSTQQPQERAAQAIDNVIRPRVAVEYNNAAFTQDGPAGSQVSYRQQVCNTGTNADSYTITPSSEMNWRVDLIDPDTGAIIATDAVAPFGVWDGGVVVNTGILSPSAATTPCGDPKEYIFRVTVPGSLSPPAGGIRQTIRLIGRSDLDNTITDDAFDETTVLPAGTGGILFFPDNSGVVTAGGYTVYTHRVVNFTGATDTFDLFADSNQDWPVAIYYDNNGDGVYSAGDIAVNNTAQLANGQSQLFFVVVNAPAGTAAGTVDLTLLSAESRLDPQIFDGATDTTTVVAPSAHDLSGGGTRDVLGGDMAVYPGTIENFNGSAATYSFSLSPASFFTTPDGFNHGTQLWFDTDGNGTVDTMIGEDIEGDGVWNTAPAPVTIPANGLRNYELRRPIAPLQRAMRDFVSLTALVTAGGGAGQADTITATSLLAVVSRASIRGLRVDVGGTVEFATGSQRGTRGFFLYELPASKRHQDRVALHDEMVAAPVADSFLPILYTVRTRPITKPFLLVEEIEVKGTRRWIGPFSVTDPRLVRAFERIEQRLAQAQDGVGPDGGSRRLSPRGMKRVAQSERWKNARKRLGEWKRPRTSGAREGVKLEVTAPGVVRVSFAELQAAGLSDGLPEAVVLTSFGRRIPFERTTDAAGMTWFTFTAEALSTDYTGRNVYVFTMSLPPTAPRVTLTRSAEPKAPATTRIEKSYLYDSRVPFGADPWMWDALLADAGTWPYPWWGPEVGQFDLPHLAPGAAGDVPVRVQLLGFSNHHHRVDARLNGVFIGSVAFRGTFTKATMSGRIPAGALRRTGNELTMEYFPSQVPNGDPHDWATVAIDFVDLDMPTVAPGPTSIAGLDRYDATLPSLRGVQYLIVTHPSFRAQADSMAALKQAQGLATAVVDTDVAYNRYSGGIVEAKAIQALIRQASDQSRGTLKYVLLVGDDTFDPQDFMGMGAVSFMPSLYAWSDESGRIPAENLYADVNDNGLPDVAIGRLPAQTPEEAQAMIDKVVAYGSAPAASASRHLFAVDNQAALDAPFRSEAQRVAGMLAPGSQVFWADVAGGIAGARTSLTNAWRGGVFATHYFGHGGVDLWADEDLLSSDDAAGLTTPRPSIVFTWGCEVNWHLFLWGPSLGEALVTAPGAGAVASFGPVGITAPLAQRTMYDEVYRRLLPSTTLRLGDVILQAKRAALAKDARTRTVVEGWILLGDPALPLAAPAQ